MPDAARPTLRSERLVLHPASLADLERLHAHWTTPEVRRFLWDDEVISVATARGAIESSESSFPRHGFGLWVVCERSAPDTLAGFVGLRFVDDSDEVEILYGLDPAYHGRGFATEASRAVLDYGFGTLALPRIIARADEPNQESRRVAERIGMDFEDVREVCGLPTAFYARRREAG